MRTIGLISVGVVVAVLLILGCPTKQHSPPPAQQPVPPTPALAGLPITMIVKQRTTTILPGTDDAISLTIDDVTRGQVAASLAKKDGSVALAPTSLVEGKFAEFKLGDNSYFLLLEELDNELIGDDSAKFVITDVRPTENTSTSELADKPTSAERETAAIERLIQHVGSLEGAVFIRNGEEHAPADAAEHLQRKWDAAGDAIPTAEAFIEGIASKSSVSGQPYLIRLSDGTETPAGEYLRARLAEFERAD